MDNHVDKARDSPPSFSKLRPAFECPHEHQSETTAKDTHKGYVSCFGAWLKEKTKSMAHMQK